MQSPRDYFFARAALAKNHDGTVSGSGLFDQLKDFADGFAFAYYLEGICTELYIHKLKVIISAQPYLSKKTQRIFFVQRKLVVNDSHTTLFFL
jgi:hypothetical protein